MMDLSNEDLDRLYEGSKNDRYIIVGSEIRQLIGMVRRLQTELAARSVAAVHIKTAEELIDLAKTPQDPTQDQLR